MARLNLIEKHISERALPGEEILSWAKWRDDLDFDRLDIRTEANVNLLRILNVDASVLKQEGMKRGHVMIARKLLQIPGFVGFGCNYAPVPDTERKLGFVIEFLKDSKVIESIELQTQLVRPVLTVESPATGGIMVRKGSSVLPKLSFEIRNRGKANAVDFSPFIQAVNASNMKISIQNMRARSGDEELLFVHSTERIVPKLAVRGEGDGIISMGYEYSDAMGNKYKSAPVDIPIMLEEREDVEVPISSSLRDRPTMMLVPGVP